MNHGKCHITYQRYLIKVVQGRATGEPVAGSWGHMELKLTCLVQFHRRVVGSDRSTESPYNRHWTTEQWKKIAWSDESRILLLHLDQVCESLTWGRNSTRKLTKPVWCSGEVFYCDLKNLETKLTTFYHVPQTVPGVVECIILQKKVRNTVDMKGWPWSATLFRVKVTSI